MKRFIMLWALVAMFLGGCTVKPAPAKKNTAGQPYDVVVVCAEDVWRGDLSYALCDLLEEPLPGLTRPQGHFNIVKHVTPERASNIDKMYPNLVVVSVNPAVSETTYALSKNLYARPQSVITLTAPTVASAIEFVEANAATLREELERGERNNSNNYYAQNPATLLMADFEEHMGVEMLIPANFFKATTREKELLWYIRDYPSRAQYIFAFRMPCDPSLTEDMQALSALGALDKMFSTITSKGAEGSYMRISSEPQSMYITPDVEINGRQWTEMRGWWEVANDFMGGPFVSYVTVDAAASEALVIAFGLYAPEDPQRNLLKELEHLIYTVK
jgi:hypothetical protein